MVKLEDRITGVMQGYEFIKVHEEFNEETQKKYYIYEQRNVRSGVVVAYDVFTPQIRTKPMPTPIPGHFLPPGEVYPGNYHFGTSSLSIGGVYGKKQDKGLQRAKEAILELIERDKGIIVKQNKKKENEIIRASERESTKNTRRKK